MYTVVTHRDYEAFLKADDQQLRNMAEVHGDIPVAAAQAAALRWFHWPNENQPSAERNHVGEVPLPDGTNIWHFSYPMHRFLLDLNEDYFDVSEDDIERFEPTAYMVVKTSDKSYVQPQPIHDSRMEWTFPEGEQPPSGGDRKFPSGTLKGKTYLNVTLENPEHFFSVNDGKKNPKYLTEYVDWVRQHYDIDDQAKKLTRRVAQSSSAAASAQPPPVACGHARTHRKGSSARFIRISCCDYGELLSNTERNVPTESVFSCTHKRTDHRGSNKYVLKTFCLDCGTHIEEVPRSLVAPEEGLSPEEQILVDSINEHDTMSQTQVKAAAQLMAVESH